MGRTDLPGGSYEAIMASLRRLGGLEGDFKVCPGHEGLSTPGRRAGGELLYAGGRHLKLYLRGHDYKYAAEQIMLTLFPGERPTYPEEPPQAGELAAVVSIFRGKVWATGKTVLPPSRGVFSGACRVRIDAAVGQVELDRALQKALKLSFYRAATAALGKEPPGALTGCVR